MDSLAKGTSQSLQRGNIGGKSFFQCTPSSPRGAEVLSRVRGTVIVTLGGCVAMSANTFGQHTLGRGEGGAGI